MSRTVKLYKNIGKCSKQQQKTRKKHRGIDIITTTVRVAKA
jgi:hypothetical protein